MQSAFLMRIAVVVQNRNPASNLTLETPQAVAFISKNVLLRVAPTMKLKPASKLVSLKSKRSVVVDESPLESPLLLLSAGAEKPWWLSAKFGPPPTYVRHALSAPGRVYSMSKSIPNSVVSSPNER